MERRNEDKTPEFQSWEHWIQSPGDERENLKKNELPECPRSREKSLWDLKEQQGVGEGARVILGQGFVGIPEFGRLLATPM